MQKLGDYIREVNVRNKDLEIELSQGICNAKYFQSPKQVADNPQTHKIVRKGQFAYNRATTRNGEKISIALREGSDCTVSSAYQVFEIIDEELLDPKYLMMWFKRPEFDRLAIFYSHGSAHEFFEWDAMCDVLLPIPSIEQQREIVSEYKTLTRRISLNEQIIKNLEATAQTLYHKMFVEGIDKENLPEGWRIGTLGEFCMISSSKRIFESEYCGKGVPFYRGKEITQKKNGEQILDLIYISEKRYNELIENYGKPQKGDILLTAVGTIGNSYMVQDEDFYFKDGNILWLHDFSITNVNLYVYEYMQSNLFKKHINELSIGSTQKALTIQSLLSMKIIFPDIALIQKFGDMIKKVYNNIRIKRQENEKLKELQSLLLAKMGK